MPVPYIDTPRTEIDGNATYLTNGFKSAAKHNLSALDSVENTFVTPSKDEDIVRSLERRRQQPQQQQHQQRRRSSAAVNNNLSTPRAGGGGGTGTATTRTTRHALDDRRNLPAVPPAKGEFTPMMQSVTRNNLLKNIASTTASRINGLGGVPKTPAYLKDGYRSNGNTPGLPPMDMSDIYEEGATASMAMDEVTPLPQVASSSPQSTPLPSLPRRDGTGAVINDGQNMLTLKEQEAAIDKLDKENFGLKLKIHYLQEQLEKAGPGYNQAALKENTELKVTKVTLQRDISRYKKNLHQAERDLEAYRLQLQELREKAKRRQMEEAVQKEMEWMREEIETRERQVKELQEEVRVAKEKDSEEVERLRDDIGDLEATLREKERIIEERDDEIDRLKDGEENENNAMSELEAELERAKEQLAELQESLEQAKTDAQEAKAEEELALRQKEEAEDNLKELQEEMANKSYSTSGLSRQMEDKAAKLEEELEELREEHEGLKRDLNLKTEQEKELKEQLEGVHVESLSQRRKLEDEIERLRRQGDVTLQERNEALDRLQQVLDDLDRKSDEKELLQTRHNALTDESGSLQRELAKSQSTIRELEQAIEDERQHALDNAAALRSQHREEAEHLQEEIEALQHEVEDKEGQFALEQDRWENERRSLQSQRDKAEEQAAGFKRTIEKLEQVELTLGGREMKLQEAIDSEKARHLHEEAVLSRQVQELNDDINSKRRTLEEQRTELLSTKEALRISRREEETLKEKVQSLEDEIIILQDSLREEQEYAKGQSHKPSSGLETQLHKVMSERQDLRDQLANVNIELHNLQASSAEIEAERDELQSQLTRLQNSKDGLDRFDQEKVELRKSKMRLENEVQRLKEEKNALVEARDSAEKELNLEIERATDQENRLAMEIAQLQDNLHATAGKEYKELALARSKVRRLESRVQELELQLEQQLVGEHEASTVAADVSVLRRQLNDAREKEKTLLQKESEHKASTRALRSRVAELEKELHEVQLKKYEALSPRSSPSKTEEELQTIRKKLSETYKVVSELKSKNRELERVARKEEDRKDLHEQLKASTLEAESLALKLSERDARVNDLKGQLRRIREERSLALKRIDLANQELELLQDRYDQAMDDISGRQQNERDRKGSSRHEKEIRGLGKEIIWLRARLRREEKFRQDLAWSKGLMELGERVRVACNEADLRLISEMGISPPEAPKPLHDARRRLRTTAFAVLATVRMQRRSQEWSKLRHLGEGLRRAKGEVLRRRESAAMGRKKKGAIEEEPVLERMGR